MRTKDTIATLSGLVLVGTGMALLAAVLLPSSLFGVAPKERTTNARQRESGASEPVAVASTSPRDASRDPGKRTAAEPGGREVGGVPGNEALRLTIPKMARIRNDVIPYAESTDEEGLRNHAAIHLKGTGFPWQRGANVYIAGHRLGYPNTDSFLAFWDLDKLRAGDRVLLTGANDKRYVYKVFGKMVVDPTDVSITRPVAGKNVLTLQTCTLPNYGHRLIIRAERVAQSAAVHRGQHRGKAVR